MDGVAIHMDFQKVQVLHHFSFIDVGTEQCIDLFGFQSDCFGLGHIVDNINNAVHYIAAAEQLHKLTGTLHSGHSHHGVQILFKLAGGLSTHT